MTFWIVTLLMVLASIIWIAYFLYKPLSQKNTQTKDSNIILYKQKLSELENDLNLGVLDKKQFDNAKTDLDNTLYYETHKNINIDKIHKTNNVFTLIVTLFFIVLVSYGIYYEIGNNSIINKIEQDNNTDIPTMGQLLAKLESNLVKNPNNVVAWNMLARSYFAMNNIAKSIAAYKKSYAIDANNEETLLGYASALAASQENQFIGKPVELITKALKINPNNIQALWLAGFVAYQQGKYDMAQTTWKHAYSLAEDNSPEKEILAKYLADIQKLKNEKNEKSDIHINITLDIDKEYKNKIAKTDTIFVYVKNANGSPMPLAVKRYNIDNIPNKITLTDDDSMMPTNKISQVNEVIITVRISKTAKINKGNNDKIIKSKVIKPKQNPNIKLTIK